MPKLRPDFVWSYSRHSPRVWHLKHLAHRPGTGHHAGGRTPSPVSTVLLRVSHVGRATDWPAPVPVCARLPPRHSFRGPLWPRFQGREYRSIPLPAWSRFPGSAPSLIRLPSKGLTPRSSLSCSLRRLLRGAPDVSSRPTPRVATVEAPDAGRCYTDLTSLAPDWPCGCGPESHWWD